MYTGSDCHYRRKYDQYEQLHSALLTGLRDQQTGQVPSSSSRPLDPTFWDAVKSDPSTTLYRPLAVYWTAMNKIRQNREKEKLQPQATSSSTQKAVSSHERPEENEIQIQLSEFQLKVIIAFSVVLLVVCVDQGVESLLGYTRAFLVQLRQRNNESKISAPREHIEDPTSQNTDACADA
ncbi:hypothetical protein BD769DRAFT_1420510 [Suillus cothurnatus]|nr:hypothetical protein BD769DRAFT_1420510 [Suillus cothurnatus]